MNDLSLSERETHLNMTADARGKWCVYSDDPVMLRRLDKIATAIQETDTGKYYELEASQVTLRKKKQLSEAQREKLREMLLKRQKPGNFSVLEAQN